MPVPVEPKIYHITHIDRLASIIRDGWLWCDAEMLQRPTPTGTTIGMRKIKQRRLTLALRSHPNLHVGDCVPFYFCPRSIMLYLIHQANYTDLSYFGGQNQIVHLEADLRETVAWAQTQGLRWAFTSSNAGARYFEDHCDLAQLDRIDWAAVQATDWRRCKEAKQAEFLIERQFPWELISRIGVISQQGYGQVCETLQLAAQKPRIEVRRNWYY